MAKNWIGSIFIFFFISSTVLYSQSYHPLNTLEVLQDLKELLDDQVGNVEDGWNTGPEIDKYFEVSKFDPGVAWCSIFLMWTYDSLDVYYKASAWSPTWFKKSTIIYLRDKYKFFEPKYGDVFGLYFRSKGRVAHVGFIIAWLPEEGIVITLEGNSNKAGSSDGDGVYLNQRQISDIYIVARIIW